AADEINDVAVTPDGSAWAATNSGLNRIRDGKGTVYRRAQGLPDDHCYALEVSARGLLVGTGAGAARLTNAGGERIARLDAHAGAHANADANPDPDPDADAGAATMVNAVLEAGADDWWFGTTQGLVHLRGGAREVFTMADGLPSDDVTALTKGRD